jgi:hypothetical protein
LHPDEGGESIQSFLETIALSLDHSSRTSVTLLGRLRRGPNDQAAWSDFVARYRPQILKWCRRNRFVAAMTGLAAAAILILAVGATFAALTFRVQRDQIRQADRNTNENLLESLTARARTTRFSRQVGHRFESLLALDHAARIARELKVAPERFDRMRDQVTGRAGVAGMPWLLCRPRLPVSYHHAPIDRPVA